MDLPHVDKFLIYFTPSFPIFYKHMNIKFIKAKFKYLPRQYLIYIVRNELSR